jgi:hypothetical protein
LSRALSMDHFKRGPKADDFLVRENSD